MITIFTSPPGTPQVLPASMIGLPQDVPARKISNSKRAVAVLLVTIIFLAPIPGGSNLAAIWMFWALLLGVTASHLSFRNPDLPAYLWKGYLPFLWAGLSLAAFATWQSLPGWVWGGTQILHHPSGNIPMRQSSLSLSVSILAAIRIFAATIFFGLCLWVSENRGRAEQIAQAIFYAVSAHAALGLILWRALPRKPSQPLSSVHGEFATGMFINHNSFATFLGMGLVLGLSLLLSSGPFGKPGPFGSANVWLMAGLTCIFAALLATQSRMGIAATFIGALVPLTSGAYGKRNHIALMVMLFAIVLIAFGQGILERAVLISSSLTTRIELYAQVSEMIKARPLVGFGADTFPWAYELFHTPPVTAGFVWNKAHSTYLAFWVEYGVIFGTTPIVAGLYTAWVLIRKLRENKGPFACAALSVLILGAAHSTVDFSLEIQANTFLFLALIALGLAPKHRSTGRRRSGPSWQGLSASKAKP